MKLRAKRAGVEVMKAAHLLPILLLGVVPPATSCHGCDSILIPGIAVTVLDSISSQRLVVDGVSVVAIDRALADTGRVSPDGRFRVLAERPGVYRVQVTAPGYLTWVREGVRVERGDCSDRTVELTARMRRTE
jgi:hypothetical protein